MSLHRSLALLAAGASALALTGHAVAAGDPPRSVELQKTHQFVVVKHAEAEDGKVPHQIMVTSRSVDGAQPSMKVKVLGVGEQDAEVFDVASLEEGETKTFTTRDGKDVVVTRGETGVTLSVDGKEIELPSVMSASVMAAGEPGFVSAWTTEGAGATAVAGEDVIVLEGGPHVMVGGPMAFAGGFDHLESLKDLDPEVRDKVVAALEEIMASHHGTGFAFRTGEPAAAGAAVPEHRVFIHRPASEVRRKVVVGRDDDRAEGARSGASVE